MARDRKKLTKAQQRIVDDMRGGRVLMQYRRDADGLAYNWDGGDGVNRRPVTTLLRRGILKLADDAMFGANSQTVVLA